MKHVLHVQFLWLQLITGCLVLIVLIVIVIFMVLRWRQDKHPIPDRVRTLATSMRQRITNTEKVLSSDGHAIYVSNRRSETFDIQNVHLYLIVSPPQII